MSGLSLNRYNTPGSSEARKTKQPKKTKKKKGNRNGNLTSDEEVDDQEARQQSQIFVLHGSFDMSQLTRDVWLDHRHSVQNGTRCIRCDSFSDRYMCTSRSLREWEKEESTRIMENFTDIFQAQRDLALLTPFVQPVIAAKVHRKHLLAITPLPSNMYLSDLKKLVVHLSHSTVRYYSACILLGLEFMRHRKIYHGNLSLTSIALDHYGRPQITDLDALLYEKIGEMSYHLDLLRFAALLGVLHCDNIRHFSIAHMHSTSIDVRRKDVFSGICPKCRLTSECMEPKLCDCNNFGALVRLIRNKIVNKDSVRRIMDVLQCTWIEADLRYSWSRIPKIEEDKLSEPDFMRSASQLMYPSERMSRGSVVAAYDEFDEDYGMDSEWKVRQSLLSLGVASSVATSTDDAKTAEKKIRKKERDWQRQQELQQSRVGSPSREPAKDSKLQLMGWSSESVQTSVPGESAPDSASQPARTEHAAPKPMSVSASTASMQELYRGQNSKRPPQKIGSEQLGKSHEQPQTPPSLDSTPPVPKPQSANPLPPTQPSKAPPPATSPPLSWQKHLHFSKSNIGSDTEPQGSSNNTLRQGIFTGSYSSGGESDPKEAKVEASHNQAAMKSPFKTDKMPNKPPLEMSMGGNVDKQASKDAQGNDMFKELKFDDAYQQMMRQNYFSGIDWATLHTAEPPEGLWFAHSPILQSYTRESAPPRAADNVGDEADRLIGSYFTSRSRILYNLFG